MFHEKSRTGTKNNAHDITPRETYLRVDGVIGHQNSECSHCQQSRSKVQTLEVECRAIFLDHNKVDMEQPSSLFAVSFVLTFTSM